MGISRNRENVVTKISTFTQTYRQIVRYGYVQLHRHTDIQTQGMIPSENQQRDLTQKINPMPRVITIT